MVPTFAPSKLSLPWLRARNYQELGGYTMANWTNPYHWLKPPLGPGKWLVVSFLWLSTNQPTHQSVILRRISLLLLMNAYWCLASLSTNQPTSINHNQAKPPTHPSHWAVRCGAEHGLLGGWPLPGSAAGTSQLATGRNGITVALGDSWWPLQCPALHQWWDAAVTTEVSINNWYTEEVCRFCWTNLFVTLYDKVYHITTYMHNWESMRRTTGYGLKLIQSRMTLIDMWESWGASIDS